MCFRLVQILCQTFRCCGQGCTQFGNAPPQVGWQCRGIYPDKSCPSYFFHDQLFALNFFNAMVKLGGKNFFFQCCIGFAASTSNLLTFSPAW